MSDELVHYAVADAVATITLDSPHNRNALSQQLVSELFERLERAGSDDAVKVVLVRQAGTVFCSGADLTEATTVGMEEGAKRIVALQRLVATLDMLAERWGVMTPDGIVLPDFLTHSVLAPIVGARRPSVTTSLKRLAEAGTVRRRADGRWVLGRRP